MILGFRVLGVSGERAEGLGHPGFWGGASPRGRSPQQVMSESVSLPLCVHPKP